jgi:hypothetical protein
MRAARALDAQDVDALLDALGEGRRRSARIESPMSASSAPMSSQI